MEDHKSAMAAPICVCVEVGQVETMYPKLQVVTKYKLPCSKGGLSFTLSSGNTTHARQYDLLSRLENAKQLY